MVNSELKPSTALKFSFLQLKHTISESRDFGFFATAVRFNDVHEQRVASALYF